MAKNLKKSKAVKDKPKFSIRAHSAMRVHGKRIEIGVRIPPDMERQLYEELKKKFDKKGK